MSLLTLVLVLLIFGFICWVITSAPIPMNPWIKNVILGILVIAMVIYVLDSFGLHTGIPLRLK